MAQGCAHIGITQHAGELPGPPLAAFQLHVARGEAGLRALRHDQVVIRKRRDLRQMGDDEHLARARRPAGHARQGFSYASPDLAADSLIHFVEDQGRDRVVLREDHLERQHEARQLAPRRHLGERTGLHPDVELYLEHHRLRPAPLGSGERYEARLEAAARHAEGR